MIDTIKKALLAGVGAAVITKEKVESALDDLVKQGKLSTGDAHIMAEKIAEQGRREFDEMGGKLNEKIHDLVKTSDSNAQTRMNALEDRVRQLEERLAAPPPPGARS
jgi:polyhydroxyalkanoate synthesis regulator phasin